MRYTYGHNWRHGQESVVGVSIQMLNHVKGHDQLQLKLPSEGVFSVSI